MKYLKYKCLLAIILGCSLSGCFDLTEEGGRQIPPSRPRFL